MERINSILKNKIYKEYLQRIEKYEQDREFCRHDMTHFLDVCRLAEILHLQESLAAFEQNIQEGKDSKGRFQIPDIDKELIYAAGLLHDIGRWQEYEEGIRHEIASADLAPEILRECGFEQAEIKEICLAIINHRNKEIKEQKNLSGILYRADKMSRPCFTCKVENECNWDRRKKNMNITL